MACQAAIWFVQTDDAWSRLAAAASPLTTAGQPSPTAAIGGELLGYDQADVSPIGTAFSPATYYYQISPESALQCRLLYRNAVVSSLGYLRVRPDIRIDVLNSLIQYAQQQGSLLGLISICMSLMSDPVVAQSSAGSTLNGLWSQSRSVYPAADSGEVFYSFESDELSVLTPDAGAPEGAEP